MEVSSYLTAVRNLTLPGTEYRSSKTIQSYLRSSLYFESYIALRVNKNLTTVRNLTLEFVSIFLAFQRSV